MNSFKEFEKNAWEKKASLYENNWGAVTRQAAGKILEITSIKPKDTLLDIGCGPGHFCNLADKLGARVIGCDLSLEMISIAKRNYPKITFIADDAEKLSFPDKTFDIVTLNYLLLHVPDQKKVLLEAIRVLKLGGVILFTLWKEPLESPALKLIFDSIKKYADTSVIPPADDIFQFARKKQAEEFLSLNGLTNFTTNSIETTWSFKATKDFFDSVLSGTRMGGTIELQNEEIRGKIREKIYEDLKQFKQDSGYLVPMPSVITSARKGID